MGCCASDTGGTPFHVPLLDDDDVETVELSPRKARLTAAQLFGVVREASTAAEHLQEGLQRLLETPVLGVPDQEARVQAVRKVQSEFAAFVTSVAVTLVHEMGLPRGQQSVQAVEGFDGAYIARGCVFKIVAASTRTASWEAVLKVALPSLHLPLEVAVDYLGWRVLAAPTVSLLDKDLDAALVQAVLEPACAVLNVAPRLGLDFHLGSDGRRYMLNPAQLLPPLTPPTALPSLVAVLTPGLAAPAWHVCPSSSAASSLVEDVGTTQEVHVAAGTLWTAFAGSPNAVASALAGEPVVGPAVLVVADKQLPRTSLARPALAAVLDTPRAGASVDGNDVLRLGVNAAAAEVDALWPAGNDHTLLDDLASEVAADRRKLKATLHGAGVNLWALGAVRHACSSPIAKAVCLQEAVARAAAATVRREWASRPPLVPAASVVADVLRALMATPATLAADWRLDLWQAFPAVLTAQECTDGRGLWYGVLSSADRSRALVALAADLGMGSLSAAPGPSLTEADVGPLTAVVKVPGDVDATRMLPLPPGGGDADAATLAPTTARAQAATRQAALYDRAVAGVQQELDLRTATLGGEHPRTLDAMRDLTELLMLVPRRVADAIPLLTTLLAAHSDDTLALADLGSAQMQQGQPLAARETLLRLSAILEARTGTSNMDWILVSAKVADTYEDVDDRLSKLMECCKQARRLVGDQDADYGLLLFRLGVAYQEARRHVEAKGALEQSVAIQTKHRAGLPAGRGSLRLPTPPTLRPPPPMSGRATSPAVAPARAPIRAGSFKVDASVEEAVRSVAVTPTAAFRHTAGLHRRLDSQVPFAATLTNLGTVLCAVGEYDAAVGAMEEALDVVFSSGGVGGLTVTLLQSLASVHETMGQHDLAYEVLLQLVQDVVPLVYGSAASPQQADAYGLLASVCEALGKQEEAVSWLEHTVRTRQELHQVDETRLALHLLGDACCAAGQQGKAVEAFEQFLATGGDHTETTDVATLRTLAQLHVSQRSHDRARELLSRLARVLGRRANLRSPSAGDVQEGASPMPTSPTPAQHRAHTLDFAGVLTDLAAVCKAQGSRDDAAALLEEAVQAYESVAAPVDVIAGCLGQLGWLYRTSPDKAADAFQRAIDLLDSPAGGGLLLAHALSNLAQHKLRVSHDEDAARELFTRCCDLHAASGLQSRSYLDAAQAMADLTVGDDAQHAAWTAKVAAIAGVVGR